ncbi:hypothetical protein KR018_001824 [Drosophila ironensis]|nr:hypothetical protein KR018_001824 [Drosophila ironensis]
MAPKHKHTQHAEEDVRLSKQLTWLLRHGAKSEGIPMQAEGFVGVPDLAQHPRFKVFTLEKLERIAATDAKQRYSLRWNPERRCHEIRANQGHSLPEVTQGLERIREASEAPLAVHGTYYRHWPAIRDQGLSRMGRNHIHFASSDTSDTSDTSDVASGFRGDCQILVYLDVEKVLADGIPLLRSSNNVILCPGIEGRITAAYFRRVVDRKNGQPLTF